VEEEKLAQGEALGLWQYLHMRRLECSGYRVFGYACVPPTPFLLKDWERYDVSRYLDPGCISPEEGWRTVPLPADRLRYRTIQTELEDGRGGRNGAGDLPVPRPAHHTLLDRGIGRQAVDGAPLDVHWQHRHPPLHPRPATVITLHGHVHESARLTGSWREDRRRTCSRRRTTARSWRWCASIPTIPRQPHESCYKGRRRYTDSHGLRRI
jgi:hypothetical protein